MAAPSAWGWVGEIVTPAVSLVDSAWYTEQEQARDAIAREGAIAQQYAGQAAIANAQVGLAQQQANVQMAMLAAGGLVVAVGLYALLK